MNTQPGYLFKKEGLRDMGRYLIVMSVVFCFAVSAFAGDRTVHSSGRAIASKKSDGKSIAAFPDVCNTPPESAAGREDAPYPNAGGSEDCAKRSKRAKLKSLMKKFKKRFAD